MKLTINRSYGLDVREVRECILAWLSSKDLPRPSYVADVDGTKWTMLADGSVVIEWTEQENLE